MLLVADAVTARGGIGWVLAGLAAIYAGLAISAILILRGMSRRWRKGEEVRAPYEPRRRPDREAAVIMTDVVAVIIWVGVIAYAVFGGADYGAGLLGPVRRRWRGGGLAAATASTTRSAPVWEANHVWLIFVLVFLWTGFPEAFAAIVTTLYIPLMLVAVGIVLRGSAFAFHKTAQATGRPGARRRLFGRRRCSRRSSSARSSARRLRLRSRRQRRRAIP